MRIQRAMAVSHRYIHFGVEIFSSAFESREFPMTINQNAWMHQ
jgi:hypothetical protein